MATKDTRKQSFNTWYEKNREAFNEARRQKYKLDKALREKYVQRQRSYRKNSPHVAKEHMRLVNGVEKEVFRIGGVAKVIGRSIDVIRYWEKQGIIPKPSLKTETHRYYTKNQMQLLKELSELIGVFATEEVKGRKAKQDHREALQLAVVKKSSEIHILWEN